MCLQNPRARCAVQKECQLLQARLFTEREVINALVHATILKEGLGDLLAAGNLEMTYTLEQGINHRSLPEGHVFMTLKQLFLFSCQFSWEEPERRVFWGKIVERAVRGGAGLLVRDVLDQELGAKAVEWMRGFVRDQPLSTNPRVFMTPPTFLNDPDGGSIVPFDMTDTEKEGAGGIEESGVGGGDEEEESVGAIAGGSEQSEGGEEGGTAGAGSVEEGVGVKG